MRPLIWYIHGAGASARSFVWLQQQLPAHDHAMITYDQESPLDRVLDRICRSAAQVDRPLTVIGHSLGGLLALGCAASAPVERIVTLCAPFGGLPWAPLMAFFRPEPLFADVSPYSPILRRIGGANPGKPHLGIVATGGFSFVPQANDGVVTVQSQTALATREVQYRAWPLNHFEVLLSDDVAVDIERFAFASA